MPIFSDIPYYSKDAGIKTYPADQGGGFYVVLDQLKVDKFPLDKWEIFEEVKNKCERELRTFLEIGESILANSPSGEFTYILNFVDQSAILNGGLLS